MKIPKTKAIELIDQKIKQFEQVRENARYENRYKEEYQLAYQGTEMLLIELFSEDESKKFRMEVTGPLLILAGQEIDVAEEIRGYKEHISSCIAQLKACKERIENFWSDEEKKTTRKSVVLFVAMSFDEADKDINEHVIGILKSLQIDFKTGERYSRESIPEKVKSRILESDLVISIFVKRDEIKSGGYTTPPWLIGEVKFAQGAKKDVIAWVERGIKDIAGLDYEKEVIYFVRDDVKEMKKATIKFLEALKEHKVI